MSDAEPYFDDSNPGDYRLFGVRYLLLPTGMAPPVAADLLLSSGPYALWTLPGVHYVQVVDTVGSIAENRTDIGALSSSFIRSSAPTEGRYLTVAYAGAAAALPTLPSSSGSNGPAGTVLSENADLAKGTVTVTVEARRTAVVLLSASYDPGWKVTVDGQPASTEIIEPAMPGVTVTAGRHVISFTYVGYQHYWRDFLVAGVSIAVAGGVSVRWRRRADEEEEQGKEESEPLGGAPESDDESALPVRDEAVTTTPEADQDQAVTNTLSIPAGVDPASFDPENEPSEPEGQSFSSQAGTQSDQSGAPGGGRRSDPVEQRFDQNSTNHRRM